VEKAVLNLVEKDFAPGLAYAGVSRVKSLNSSHVRREFRPKQIPEPVVSIVSRAFGYATGRIGIAGAVSG
jgi:hypothetical protein